MMNKTTFFRSIGLSSLALGLVACSSNLSEVSEEGYIENPVFPKIEDEKFNNNGKQFGSWPNWQNVSQIERGMNKTQLYSLIGRPHFSEGLYGVREWDYVFNYRENGQHKMCQFKIGFDKEMIVQSFLWYPNGCNGNSTHNLSSDFLFDFDKDNLTESGKALVADIARQLKETGAERIRIAGHTDRLGTEEYNIALSQRRAETVKNLLMAEGVMAKFDVVGYGKAQQVKLCAYLEGQELKDCLRPNRRVEVFSNGGMSKQPKNNSVAGPLGPTPLYEDPEE